MKIKIKEKGISLEINFIEKGEQYEKYLFRELNHNPNSYNLRGNEKERVFSLDKYKSNLDNKYIEYINNIPRVVSPIIDKHNKSGFGYKFSHSVDHKVKMKSKFDLPLLM